MSARSAAMPVLLSFDEPWESPIFAQPAVAAPILVDPPEYWPLTSGLAAALVLDQPSEPGLNLHEPFPDWSAYQALTFVAASMTGDPLKVILRIHNHDHNNRSTDRFNRSLEIGTQARRYTVSLDDVASAPERRKLDLRQDTASTRNRGIAAMGQVFVVAQTLQMARFLGDIGCTVHRHHESRLT